MSFVQFGQFATGIWEETGFLEQDVEPVYAEICEDWRSLGGAPPPEAADPAEVADLIGDILVHPDPALRYPIGAVAGMTARLD